MLRRAVFQLDAGRVKISAQNDLKWFSPVAIIFKQRWWWWWWWWDAASVYEGGWFRGYSPMVTPRGGSRIQKGGFVHSEGGFRTGISGADPNCCRVLGKSTSKKKLQTAVGGVSDHPKKTPVSAHDTARAILSTKLLF